MKSFLIALQFLTILPVQIKSEIKPEDFGRSCLFFPLVGALIGVLLAVFPGLFAFLPYPVICVFILAAEIIVTGGMHLDGFADTCDGLYGFKNKERSLEIMRDSHIGTMAVVGVVVLLLLKFSLLFGIEQGSLWKALIMMAAFSRWAQTLACFLADYPRQEGKAKYFIEHISSREVLLGAIFTFFVFFILLKMQGIILFFLSLLTVLLWINFIKAKINGMTGDTVGSVNEIAEVTVLLFILILA
ncbi:MAG TPA: adenosylcobinamide-GDP ribazoletransferase [Candidatus Omnitrophota bacterium]|nr:adenosylcobinamide-GDP ribazoletransferase [Candidatus Omnitrophota bacterium]